MDPVVHFEIPAVKMDRARDFYKKVFRWTFKEWNDGYYLASTAPVDKNNMVKNPGNINGALQKKDKSIGSPRVVVNVGSIKKTLQKVRAGGGKILQDITEIQNMMYYAIVRDTEGNELGVIETIPMKKTKSSR